MDSRTSPAFAYVEDDAPATRREPSIARVVEGRGAAASRPHEVVVFYREPGFAQHAGLEERTHNGRFVVHAADEEGAIEQALREFHTLARDSGVGWTRVVDRVTCRVLEPESPGEAR